MLALPSTVEHGHRPHGVRALKLSLVLCCFVSLIGCTTSWEHDWELHKISMEACKAQGGVPAFVHGHDNSTGVVTCTWPPASERERVKSQQATDSPEDRQQKSEKKVSSGK